jgi:hypothetical protein
VSTLEPIERSPGFKAFAFECNLYRYIAAAEEQQQEEEEEEPAAVQLRGQRVRVGELLPSPPPPQYRLGGSSKVRTGAWF